MPDLEPAEPALPLWVKLSDDVCRAAAQQPEAVLAGLKALNVLGVWGVALDVHWSQVEQLPQQYSWSTYRPALALAREAGLKLQVNFCFHTNQRHELPDWVLQIGEEVPDIFFTDKAGERCKECLTLGIDDVPVLDGRSAVQCYADVMSSFVAEHPYLVGTTVTDVRVGLGPAGELRYPSHPAYDGRWAFPGVGEFQCYDAFMAASLAACARQAGQPHWGTGGPHDACGYTHWPHQTGFFHHQGSWSGEYGRWFAQYYGGMLARHADAVLAAAAGALAGRGVRLHAALPLCHWWYHSASRAAELTSGYCGGADRDAYLPAMQALARHGASAHLLGGELANSAQPPGALASPEALLNQQRGVAAALGVPVTLCNSHAGGFDGRRLAELERKAFDWGCYQGVDVPPASRLMLSEMGDAMFEPASWTEFRGWATRMQQRAAALGGVAAGRRQRRRQQQLPGQAGRRPLSAEALAPQEYPASRQQQEGQAPGQGPDRGPGPWQAAVLVS